MGRDLPISAGRASAWTVGFGFKRRDRFPRAQLSRQRNSIALSFFVVGALVGWVVDAAYKNSAECKATHQIATTPTKGAAGLSWWQCSALPAQKRNSRMTFVFGLASDYGLCESRRHGHRSIWRNMWGWTVASFPTWETGKRKSVCEI